MTTTLCAVRTASFIVFGALFAAGLAQAGPEPADAEGRYRQDMSVCNSGLSHQAAGTCRTEAHNALAEAKRGRLNDESDQYSRNAVRRCAAFQGDERTACEARVFNPSRVDGSVAGGGLLRESVIQIPAR